MVKLRTEVHVRVLDRVAEIEVEEWFENRGGGLGEGDYVYPLPGEAVFSNFSLYQGDEELRGETMDAERARAIYEEIVRQQRDPALIELIGHGMVRARVFPFQPGETRRITMRYTQVLDRAGDALLFRNADEDEHVALLLRVVHVIAGREAVATVIGFLDHQNPEIRKYAIETLGEITDPSTIDYLLARLDDPDIACQQAAAICSSN